MHFFDYLILALVLFLLALAVRFCMRHRGASCCGSCADCPLHHGCHKK